MLLIMVLVMFGVFCSCFIEGLNLYLGFSVDDEL